MISFDVSQHIEKSSWKSIVDSFLKTLECHIRLFPCDSSHYSGSIYFSRFGCDLQIKYVDLKCPEELKIIIDGLCCSIRYKLQSICVGCGKDKGKPPSFTVYPALCEECRDKLSPDDFKKNMIICMSGKAGSGKDTVAQHLVDNYGFIRMALADPIRDIVQLVFVFDHDSVWDRDLREIHLKFLPAWTVRKLLQYIGTELFRTHILSDIWVRNFIRRAEPGFNYIVTDVRFPNELDEIKKAFGGKTLSVEVVRNGCEGKNIGIQNHESEKYRLPADVIIENNGTLDYLYKTTDEIIESNKFVPFVED